MTVIPFPPRLDLFSAAPVTDALADLVFAQLLDRETELIALAEADADAGVPGEEELSLAVARALLRLILSPNVRMPLSRLQ